MTTIAVVCGSYQGWRKFVKRRLLLPNTAVHRHDSVTVGDVTYTYIPAGVRAAGLELHSVIMDDTLGQEQDEEFFNLLRTRIRS